MVNNNTDRIIKVAIYSRVSTQEQADTTHPSISKMVN